MHQSGYTSTMRGKAFAERKEKQEAAQFMAAWEMKPRRYKTKFQRSLYAGQTARRDAGRGRAHPLDSRTVTARLGCSRTHRCLACRKARQRLHAGSRPQSFYLAFQSLIAKEVLFVSHRVVYPLEIEHYTDLLEGEALRTVQPR